MNTNTIDSSRTSIIHTNMTAPVAEPTEIAELVAVGKKNQHNINMDGTKHFNSAAHMHTG